MGNQLIQTLIALGVALQLATLARALLRPHREPASRIAWVAVIAAVPILGVVAYIFFGEVNIGRRRAEKMRRILAALPALPALDSPSAEALPEVHEHLFRVGTSISGFPPVAGNSGRLLADSNAAIESLVADIDAAREHVHLLFYIWLPDNNGRKVAEALGRAARRGVTCRTLVDGLGSRLLLRSELWKEMQSAGVRTAVALTIGNPLLRTLVGRIDLRNHRKIAVIDNSVTYCGSQNCADPEFRVKARFAPWVDCVARFEGPVARQNQRLFAIDWMSSVDENIEGVLRSPAPRAGDAGFVAQVIGTGPTSRCSAMPEMFESLIYSARRELVVTTPYYVPDEAMQTALCSASFRGVRTTLVVPARNDSWIVAGASRSYYSDLLDAGVTIMEYVGGLLHSKTLALDEQVTLIGSANMDRRSFDLNYENNILVHDPAFTREIRRRQDEYIARSRQVTRETVRSWSVARRLWNNTMAMLGPVL